MAIPPRLATRTFFNIVLAHRASKRSHPLLLRTRRVLDERNLNGASPVSRLHHFEGVGPDRSRAGVSMNGGGAGGRPVRVCTTSRAWDRIADAPVLARRRGKGKPDPVVGG